MSIKKHIHGHEEHQGAISISLISALIVAGGVFAATDVPLMTKFFKIKKQNAVGNSSMAFAALLFPYIKHIKSSENKIRFRKL